MPKKIKSPKIIQPAGNKPKIIKEYIGLINSDTNDISIAHMHSPQGWEEPGQKPEFDEYTLVLNGCLKVETKQGNFFVKSGEAIITYAGEWIRYSTPDKSGAQYIAVCIPAFNPDRVNRDVVK